MVYGGSYWSRRLSLLGTLLGDPPLTTGQKKDQQKADNENTAAGKKKKVTAAQLRVQRGMSTWL